MAQVGNDLNKCNCSALALQHILATVIRKCHVCASQLQSLCTYAIVKGYWNRQVRVLSAEDLTMYCDTCGHNVIVWDSSNFSLPAECMACVSLHFH